MATFGFGGNNYFDTGQIQLLATAEQIPFPSNTNGFNPTLQTTFTGMEGQRRKISATNDMYVGNSNALSVANGYYVPAGKEFDCTVRAPIWVIGVAKAGESSSSSLSASLGVSSSSSSSSLVPVVTYGTVSWYEEFNT